MTLSGSVTHPTRANILKHLESVLASALFSRAERQRRFLDFIVRQTLEGRAGELKEYRVGVEVYERPDGYDPREDPIVRVEASRLRARLREYYATAGSADPVRIEVPKGSYVPEFTLAESPPGPADRREARRWPVLAATAGAVLLTLAGLWWSSRTPAPMNEQARIHHEKARQMHMLMTAGSLRDALEEQQKAVAADPRSALAHAGMAHILISSFCMGNRAEGEDPALLVQPWIDRSFALQPGNSDASAALIRLHRDLELDLEKARQACSQVLRTNSAGNAVRVNCAIVDAAGGRFDHAVVTLQTAIRQHPTRESLLMSYGQVLYLARRYEELVQHCRQVRKHAPSLWEAVTLEAGGLVGLGRAGEAVGLLKSAPGLEDREPLRSMLAFALARSGQRAEAELWLSRSNSNQARTLLALGRREEALAWLEANWAIRGAALWQFVADPALAELAGEPRFEAIRKGMRF